MSDSIVNPRYQGVVLAAGIATGVAGLATLAPWQLTRIVGLTTLTGVGYGIANDMVATRDCIEYFTVGHFYDGQEMRHRLVHTLDPNINALAWGAVATWWAAALAGAAIATVARIPLYGAKWQISAGQIARLLVPGAAGLGVLAHLASRLTRPNPRFYARLGIPEDFHERWHKCNARNTAGYVGLAAGVIALLVGMILMRYRGIPTFLTKN